MAKKQEKEIERWVTVNGARVPIFKDGSVGGPKALRDKVKAVVKEKSSDGKSLKDMSATDIGKEYLTATGERKKALLKELHNRGYRRNKDGSWGKKESEKSGVTRKEKGTKLSENPYTKKAMDDMGLAGKKWDKLTDSQKQAVAERASELEDRAQKRQAKKVDKESSNSTKKNETVEQAMDRLQKESRAKVDSMSAQQVMKYAKENGLRGLKTDTLAQRDDRVANHMYMQEMKKWREQKNVAENEALKEKQIAQNKAQKDERNNQVSDRVKSYQDKFLKKRSVEEIKEIQSNIEKAGTNLGYTDSDMVAMRAIENELKERSSKQEKKLGKGVVDFDLNKVDPEKAKAKRIQSELKAEDDDYDRRHNEGKYAKDTSSKTWTEKDKERYEAVRAYSRGEISPEEMKNYGFTDKQLKDISEMGRREALQNVVEGKNKRTYIDPMGNLNRKKVRSKYEENYGEDYRNMSVAEARERLADDGKTNHRIINGKDVKKLDDHAILQLSVNQWKYNLTKLQSKALDDEIKSRGYVYLNGGWHKKK